MNAETSDKHKFEEDAGMTFQEVYDFAYRGSRCLGSISLLKSLANELGEDRFIETLKRAASQAVIQAAQSAAKNRPNTDLATLGSWLRDPDRFTEHVLTYDIVEDTERVFEVRVTECLWAKTFRDGDASDIGYAALCHTDYAASQAFNPKIRLIRTKTLMQGDDCCDARWVYEE